MEMMSNLLKSYRQLCEENEQLRELVEAGKEDRKSNNELVDENLRLRDLLKGVVDDMVIGHVWEDLLMQIEKEVSDE
jgi:cell shape-determining protein MreC